MTTNRLLSLALLLGLWPVVEFFAQGFIQRGEDLRGLLPICVVVFGAWVARQKREEPLLSNNNKGLKGLALLLVCYLVTWAVLPMTISVGLGLIALWWGMAGRFQVADGRLALIMLLILALPIAREIDFYAGFPLRVVATQLSSYLLWPLHGQVETLGTTMVIAGAPIEVDAPCSGLRMLWVGLVVVLSNAALRHFSAKRTLLALLSGLIVILLANSLRSSLLALAEVKGNGFSEFKHDAIGLLIFAGAMSLVLVLGIPRRTA